MNQLTKEQAAVIGLYTGWSCGPFADIQELADRLLGCPTFTHQFADAAEELLYVMELFKLGVKLSADLPS